MILALTTAPILHLCLKARKRTRDQDVIACLRSCPAYINEAMKTVSRCQRSDGFTARGKEEEMVDEKRIRRRIDKEEMIKEIRRRKIDMVWEVK